MELIIEVIKLFFSILEGVLELLFKTVFGGFAKKKGYNAGFVPQGTILNSSYRASALQEKRALV